VSVSDPAGAGAHARAPLTGHTGASARVGGEANVRILFVCLGNICRSPTAEGAMRALVRQAGLEGQIELDSAGTGAWHVGEPPDARATAAARRRGIVLEGAARQVRQGDYEEFDLILAMDQANLRELRRLAPSEGAAAKVRLLREFDPAADGDLDVSGDLDVPDPYYGGPDGFDRVLDLVQGACASLLQRLTARSAAAPEL
jgi:protein-tyrosine phosphatase